MLSTIAPMALRSSVVLVVFQWVIVQRVKALHARRLAAQ